MIRTASSENALTLARALGIAEGDAARLLLATIVVTAGPLPCDARCAELISSFLSRTFDGDYGRLSRPDLEIAVGAAERRTRARRVTVTLNGTRAEVSAGGEPTPSADDTPDIVLLLAACYAAAVATRLVVGSDIAVAGSDQIAVDLRELLGDDLLAIGAEIDIGEAYLAGAGAIGNAFLLGLGCFRVRGTLHVVDPDVVSRGNLNRCHFFKEADVGDPKALALVRHTAIHLRGISLVPHVARLQDAPGSDSIRRLVVGVDSRRARRALQEQIPKEVYDASTTGIREIVLHFNDRIEPRACLACVYHVNPDEEAHERHVAEALGVTAEDVRTGYIGAEAAASILRRYPQLTGPVKGEAYDTLFKQLCGAELLRTNSGEQVVAPFSFVSVLGGALLALEFVRRAYRGTAVRPFNYWRVSPWAEPNLRLRQMRSPRSTCQVCGRTVFAEAAEKLWRSA